MRNNINKEKAGITVRFSVRIPKEQHRWLKVKAKQISEKTGKYVSMNDYISKALTFFIENYKE